MGGHRGGRGRGGYGAFGDVDAPIAYGLYGDITDNSPSALYKKYVGWFTGQYGTSKAPLTFPNWLAWAQKNGMVPADGKMNASGRIDMELPPLAPINLSADATPMVIDVNVNVKKSIVGKICMALAVVAALGVLVSFAKNKTA